MVLTPRRWRQVGGSIPLATVTRKPDHRGDHVISRKTIARGMPGDAGEPVVTNSYALLFCMRGCGRIERPAFPAPSEVQMALPPAKLARSARRDRGGVGELRGLSLRGANATKQSTFPVAHGLLR